MKGSSKPCYFDSFPRHVMQSCPGCPWCCCVSPLCSCSTVLNFSYWEHHSDHFYSQLWPGHLSLEAKRPQTVSHLPSLQSSSSITISFFCSCCILFIRIFGGTGIFLALNPALRIQSGWRLICVDPWDCIWGQETSRQVTSERKSKCTVMVSLDHQYDWIGRHLRRLVKCTSKCPFQSWLDHKGSKLSNGLPIDRLKMFVDYWEVVE